MLASMMHFVQSRALFDIMSYTSYQLWLNVERIAEHSSAPRPTPTQTSRLIKISQGKQVKTHYFIRILSRHLT